VSLLNGPGGYGALTKALHWSIAGLFAFQYVAASIMTRIGPAETALGLSQASWFNWHKTIGLLALGLAVVRLVNRRLGELPPWAPTLSDAERGFIHRAEQVLYAAMLVMPLSGFVYVMAGGYGVLLFGRFEIANPIGAWPTLATGAKWLHIAGGWVLLAALAGHIGLVLRHQFVLGDGLLRRMLVAPRQPD
jgi:cytochrome b561